MNVKQKQIAVAMATAFAYSGFLLTFGGHLFAPVSDTQDQLSYILAWLLLPALSLLMGIGNLARTRFFDSGLIDGEAPEQNSRAEIDARYLQNTLEQFALASIVFMSLGAQLHEQELPLIAALCSNFFLMRILFWVGYRKLPQLRAIGFAGTFYPTVGAFVYAAWLATH